MTYERTPVGKVLSYVMTVLSLVWLTVVSVRLFGLTVTGVLATVGVFAIIATVVIVFTLPPLGKSDGQWIRLDTQAYLLAIMFWLNMLEEMV